MLALREREGRAEDALSRPHPHTQAGARVVGIPHDAFDNAKADLDTMLGSLNGVLFTGGGLSLAPDTAYYRTGHYIFQQVQAINDAGVHFPLHGTCMGFEFLSILGAGGNASVLQPGFDSEGLTVPLEFTREAKTSTLFGSAPANILNILATQNVTSNLHHDGVTPDTYATNANLSAFYNVLSTNTGRQGRRFVSTVEAKRYPIRGTQWHPERPQFEWNPALNLPHSGDAMLAMQYMADFFVSQARMNDQSVYASPAALALAQKYTTYTMKAMPMSSDVLEGYYALLFAS